MRSPFVAASIALLLADCSGAVDGAQPADRQAEVPPQSTELRLAQEDRADTKTHAPLTEHFIVVGHPAANVNADQAVAGAEVQGGRDEAARRLIYAKLMDAEDRGTRDADLGKGSGPELREKYRLELAKELDISDDELIAIGVEAYKKGWAN